jgi:hypothetical protein
MSTQFAYHKDRNLILQQAFQTKADKHHIFAFNTIMAQMAACRLSVDLNIRDNKASAEASHHLVVENQVPTCSSRHAP